MRDPYQKTKFVILGKGEGPRQTIQSLLPYEVATTWSTILDLKKNQPELELEKISWKYITALHDFEKQDAINFTLSLDEEPLIITEVEHSYIPGIPETLTDSIAILLYFLILDIELEGKAYPTEIRLMRCSYLDPAHFFNRVGTEVMLSFLMGKGIAITIDEPTALMKYPIYPQSIVSFREAPDEQETL